MASLKCLFTPVWLCVQQQVCDSFLALGEKVMQDDEFTCDLFRFLQLLCEGHNSGECLLDESSFNILNHSSEITENKQHISSTKHYCDPNIQVRFIYIFILHM